MSPLKATTLLALFSTAFLARTQSFIEDSLARGAEAEQLRTSTMFMPKYTYASGEENWGIAAGDLNHDGSADLVSASKSDGNINVHYNDGIGVFSQAQQYYVDVNNRALAVFDVNNDDWADVVSVTAYGKLCVFLNDKTGALKRPIQTDMAWGAHDIAFGDFNLDEKMDIAIASSEERVVSTYIGDGRGNFTFRNVIQTADKARAVRIADINGDATPDLIVGCDDDRVYLYANRAGEDFDYFNYLRCGLANWAVEVGDFNGDHLIDVAALGYEDKMLYVHYNTGYGKFRVAPCLMGGSHTFDLVAGDIDNDGDIDLVSCSTTDASVNAFRNIGRNTFESIGSIASGNWNSGLVLIDADKDGALDVATASIKDNNVNIHLNVAVHQKKLLAERASASNELPVKLQGTVLDNSTKNPLVNANVYLMTIQGEIVQSQITDPKGQYAFQPERGERYQLSVQPLGMDAYRDTFVMPGYDHKIDVFVRHNPGSSIKGRIIDGASKEPLANAFIEVLDTQSGARHKIQTNAAGEYAQPLKVGITYQLSATSESYDTDIRSIHIPKQSSGRTVVKDLVLTPLSLDPVVMILHGNIVDANTQEGIRSAQVIVVSADKKLRYTQRTNEKGEYSLSVPEGQYEVSVNPSDYYFISQSIPMYRSLTQASFRFDAALHKLTAGTTIPLTNIRFGEHSRTLSADAKLELDRLAHLLKENSFIDIQIMAHAAATNADDSDELLAMSQAQAQAVEIYLIQKGVDDVRVDSQGYGDKHPVAPNDTPEHRAMNRRVELRIVK